MDFNKEVRLIGYYNKPNQGMTEEEKYVGEVKKLSRLLEVSFDSLINNRNIDPIFKSILLGNTVFILKDEDHNLIAYYPYKSIARISDVIYNREKITQIPLEYKSWFVPGQKIQIYHSSKEENGKYKSNYVITTSGSDFLITKGNKTRPLDWSEDTYISIKDLYKLVEDRWLSLYEFNTDEECSDCEGYNCNNSCFYYRHKYAVRFILNYNNIDRELKPLINVMHDFRNRPKLSLYIFEQNYKSLESAYEHCSNLSEYFDEQIFEEYIENMNYCKSIYNTMKLNDKGADTNIYINGNLLARINLNDTICEDRAIFGKTYHLVSNGNIYDNENDRFINFDYKLKFNGSEVRDTFIDDYNKGNIKSIYLLSYKSEYEVASYSPFYF